MTDFYLFNPSHSACPVPPSRPLFTFRLYRIEKTVFQLLSFSQSFIHLTDTFVTDEANIFYCLDGLVCMGWMDGTGWIFVSFLTSFLLLISLRMYRFLISSTGFFLSFTQLLMPWNLKFWFELNRGRGNDDFRWIL